jgi:phenylalanine-4-hydroxylase
VILYKRHHHKLDTFGIGLFLFLFFKPPDMLTQHHDRYTAADHQVWNILFERQKTNLQDKAHPRYLACLSDLGEVLNGDGIPQFDHLSDTLEARTGWRIEVVPGLIPVPDFLDMLAAKRFPSSTWLRRMDQLDYLEEPDMFHDIFGHVPLLADTRYADLMHRIGLLGQRLGHTDLVLEGIERLYWFTIEFGLTQHNDQTRIYGAGILSSFGETNAIFAPDAELHQQPFVSDRVLDQPFRKDELQQQYYILDRWEELFETDRCLELALCH